MIKDITIGQYFNGNSLLHRLDARMKIILTVIFIVSIFLCQNFWSLGLMLLFTLVTVTISRVPLTAGKIPERIAQYLAVRVGSDVNAAGWHRE